MPKLKTHTGAKKRFSKTGTGKIKRGQTKTRHILTSKSPKVKRKLGKTLMVSDGDYLKVARMIPYGISASGPQRTRCAGPRAFHAGDLWLRVPGMERPRDIGLNRASEEVYRPEIDGPPASSRETDERKTEKPPCPA
jgi:large subunit ribosomal protein L35